MFWYLALMSALLLSQSGSSSSQSGECVRVASNGRLARGATFVSPLPLGLELRIKPGLVVSAANVCCYADGWDITVGPAGRSDDYLWMVSPPYQTAPHRKIGAGYGLSNEESVQIEREFRFVLRQPDYERAIHIAVTDPAGPEKQAELA